MPELVLLVLGLAAAGGAVLAPLLRAPDAAEPVDDEREAARIRHRVALESLRDVEADHRAGSLDDAAYALQLGEAEARAAQTLAAAERAEPPLPEPGAPRGRTMAVVLAGVIGLVVVAGVGLGAGGLANATVVNQSLADAQAAEAERQAEIAELLDALAGDPTDAETLSDLADAYLAGSTGDDLARAAASLQLLIAFDPDRADGYERLMTAYLRAGDHVNARAVHDSYATIATADPVELAFFDGLIALRGEDDPARALAAFDRFLDLAADDPRADMVSGLREEAAESASEP